MTYKCTICGTDSDASVFYSGMNTRCKECHKAKVRENRAAKADYYRAYDAERFKTDPKVLERHKRYQATIGGKASMNASRRKWAEANSDKHAAHTILGNAVRDGRIEKPEICTICGAKSSRIHGHHHDYSLPLAVLWCCPKCHADIHKGMKCK